jgi:hypothetical protein
MSCRRDRKRSSRRRQCLGRAAQLLRLGRIALDLVRISGRQKQILRVLRVLQVPHFVLMRAQAPAPLMSALGVVQHDSVSVGDGQYSRAIFAFCRSGYA